MTLNSPLDFRHERGVATLTLNRPDKLNAVTGAMTTQIREWAEKVNHDDAIRVLVVTGTGKAFCAGSDIDELNVLESVVDYHRREEYAEFIRQIEKPVIAAVNGYALGGGLELALACDIRVASEKAFFGAPEINLGWVGRGGNTQMLPRLVGAGKAAHMLFTGDMIDAQEAHSYGLVEELHPPEELQKKVQQLAERIAEKSPFALKIAKRSLRASLNMSLEAGLRYEWESVSLCFATEDRKEGIRAFKEKRKPVFRGR